MVDIGMDPDTPCMAPLVRLLTCVTGPKEGSVLGGMYAEVQARQHLLNRYCSYVSEVSVAAMVTSINADK